MRSFRFLFPLILLSNSACTTLNQSLELGAATGVLTGAGATYLAQTTSRSQASAVNVGYGAAVGLGVGLLTSYLIHQSVVQDRADNAHETEIRFGDLPPSPFVFPIPKPKGGK